MKNSTLKKEQKIDRSKKAPAVVHEQKTHPSRQEEQAARPRPIGGRFGKKWFPYHH